MLSKIDITKVKKIAQEAGDEILRIYYDGDFSSVVDFKDDNSPLTLADKAAHVVIMKGLEEAYPEIPIISEEGEGIEYEKRKNWEYFWLVDPLDGTKEFIKRNGQFTVNIALIHNKKPVLGVIYTPVTKDFYYGSLNNMAFKQGANEEPKEIKVKKSDGDRIAVRSRSHAAAEEEVLLKKYDVTDSISVGSSLKFCMVAEGKADIYYRHGPTMEWDTAAGQAVLEAAGGSVYIEASDVPFTYNKESLLNTGFLCMHADIDVEAL